MPRTTLFLLFGLIARFHCVENETTQSSKASNDVESLLREFMSRFEAVETRQNDLINRTLDVVHSLAGSRGNEIDDSVATTSTIDHLTLLPKDYDKRQHPPKASDEESNPISVTMDIYSIPQLDEKLEEIMLEVRVSHYWYDTRLIADFKQPIELVPSAVKEFWTPDSYFHHAKDAKEVSLITTPASLRITPDKMIKYTMMSMVTIGCPMSFQYYPMDRQTCRLELQSFGYSLEYNNYTWRRKPFLKRDINLDNFDVAVEQYSFSYSSDGLRYPGLGLRIELRRYMGYHVIQTYIPSVIFVAVAWLSFLVPSDIIPGRMVLCVTTLLTLTSMFNSVRGLTPQVSYMKAIDLWVFTCICFVFFSLAEYGVILHLTSRSAWQKRMDEHVREMTGKRRIHRITPAQLVNVAVTKRRGSSGGSSDGGGGGGLEMRPDFLRGPSGLHEVERGQPRPSMSNSSPAILAPSSSSSSSPPSSSSSPKIPRTKERLAYTIEITVKWAYPLLFALFNLVYWGFYLKGYSTAPAEA